MSPSGDLGLLGTLTSKPSLTKVFGKCEVRVDAWATETLSIAQLASTDALLAATSLSLSL